jgi:hypothetical protein
MAWSKPPKIGGTLMLPAEPVIPPRARPALITPSAFSKALSMPLFEDVVVSCTFWGGAAAARTGARGVGMGETGEADAEGERADDGGGTHFGFLLGKGAC